uniref:Uncharacterized protein n=1 Tax=Strombidium rassoulzadegani TaxID=1082188 RepID=A0A7S3FT51_9SPIT|mmetsp:Transcript_1571/g.2772  ORF Transcript_1571/g.2772 Transcript_1571/m.2772 type:complete len:135 (+) Transcript_1571:771-1175(+)
MRKQIKVERAKFVSGPTEPVVGASGDRKTLIFKLKNNTEWSFKRGCRVLSQFEDNSLASRFIEPVNFEIGDNIEGNCVFQVVIDLKFKHFDSNLAEEAIKELVNAHNGEARLQVCGPRGSFFGDQMIFKFGLKI